MEFYTGAPHDLDAYRMKLAEVQRRFGHSEREAAAAALRPSSERARERLDRFVREGGAVVTTGQQAGFLTGPLYTLYKALSAARLAHALEQRLGVLVLPVFWTASEDHDWAEVNHADLGTRAGVRRIQLVSPDTRALPMSARRLEQDIESACDQLRYSIGEHADADRLINLVRDAYRPGVAVADAFSQVMGELLAPFDLLLTDAADPALKQRSRGVLRRALVASEEEERLLRERGRALRAAGYGEQVPILEGATNVFYDGDGERERLYRRGEDYVTATSGRRHARADLLAELDRDPARFSPNVLLRPVVESAVFPTLAYVGGPGELAYFGQLGVLFPRHGMDAPVAFPRFSATLLEAGVRKDLERLDLTPPQIERPRHELVETLARGALPEAIEGRLTALGDDLAAGYRDLIEAAEELDPTLRGALGALRNESLARIGRAERKILRAVKRREHSAIQRLDRARDALFPYGEAQERVLNVLPFLAREPDLLERISAAIGISMESRFEAHAPREARMAGGAPPRGGPGDLDR